MRNLKTLRRYRLDDGFADRVLRRAERELLTAGGPQADGESLEPVSPAKPREQESSWRGMVWTAIVVAAAVVLMVVFRGTPNPENILGPNNGPEIVEHVPPEPEDPLTPEIGPTIEGPQVAVQNNMPDGNLQLVNSIRKNCGRRLILVYEVLVTPEGVENAAFANVFRRQGIRFQQTVPVMREQQLELLQERYLDDVQIFDTIQPNMDEIEMYLVSCTGRVADDLYFDLKRPPEGVSGFMLNLATIDADQGVLNRLCDAAKLQERSNEAIELLVNFAMLSTAKRDVVGFGSIGYIDPVLLNPARPAEVELDEGAEPGQQPAGQDAKPPMGDDFPCELLFVVRNMRAQE